MKPVIRRTAASLAIVGVGVVAIAVAGVGTAATASAAPAPTASATKILHGTGKFQDVTFLANGTADCHVTASDGSTYATVVCTTVGERPFGTALEAQLPNANYEMTAAVAADSNRSLVVHDANPRSESKHNYYTVKPGADASDVRFPGRDGHPEWGAIFSSDAIFTKVSSVTFQIDYRPNS